MILRLAVGGMYSVHARRALETALSGVTGIRHLDVSPGSVLVGLDGDGGAEAIRQAITAAGLEVLSTEVVRRHLSVLPPDAPAGG